MVKRSRSPKTASKAASRSRSRSRSRSASRSRSRSRSRSASPSRRSVTVTRRMSVSRSPRRNGGGLTVTRKMSVSRSRSPRLTVRSPLKRAKRSPNEYIKFGRKYRQMHPMRGVPFAEQSRMIAAAYRRAQGRGHLSPSPARVPPSATVLKRMSPHKPRRSPTRK